MVITNWGTRNVTVCNCCYQHKGEDGDDGTGWYHSGRVDYCPKCARLLLEKFQTKLARP